MPCLLQRRKGGLLDEPRLDPNAFLPTGLRAAVMRDWVVSPGVTLRSTGITDESALGPASTGGLRYIIALRKAPQVRLGRVDMHRRDAGAACGLCMKLTAGHCVPWHAGVRDGTSSRSGKTCRSRPND